jgi:hypothetical protein
MRCYIDSLPCDCNSHDVANDCPRDPYCHTEDEDFDSELVSEEMIDEGYQAKSRHQSEEECYERF